MADRLDSLERHGARCEGEAMASNSPHPRTRCRRQYFWTRPPLPT